MFCQVLLLVKIQLRVVRQREHSQDNMVDITNTCHLWLMVKYDSSIIRLGGRYTPLRSTLKHSFQGPYARRGAGLSG